LYEEFKKITSNTLGLSKELFVAWFPYFSDEMVLKSLFKIFNTSISGEIDFENYVQVLSIMSRGSAEQRVERKISTNFMVLIP
jgi:hypothetical protein